MAKIKIIDVLKSLSEEELRLLRKFVNSPIHNRHKQVALLFDFFRKELKDGKDNIPPEKIYQQLFPGEPIKLQKLHHISSYLLKVTEDFLAWHEWRINEPEYNFHLMRSFRKHHLNPPFQKKFNLLSTLLHNNTIKDSKNLRLIYDLELEFYNQARTLSKSRDSRLQELSDALDLSFVAEKLKTACMLLNNQSYGKTKYVTGMLDSVLRYVEENSTLQTPSIAVYYFATKTLSNQEDDDSFQKLKLLLDKHSNSFQDSELYDLYILSINYCIRRINMGEHRFMKEVFEVYKTGMTTEVFVQNGTMAPRTYSNIIMSGLRSTAFDWVEKFIYKYKTALPEKQREGFFNYNLARYYFEKNDYSKAMPLLILMDYEDALLTSLGKILLAQMYFELNEFESLNSLLQSFKIFIKRKQLPAHYREGYLNFAKFVGKILHIKHFAEITNLTTEIKETKILTEKVWLLEQVKTKGTKLK